MPAHTAVSPETSIAAAKAAIQAYNDKNWQQLKAITTPNFVYDEVATGRRVQGVDQYIELCKGWAQAFPDSKATFGDAFASGDTVVLELTWKGTHKGELQSPKGSIPPTGKQIEIRACTLFELSGEKAAKQRHYFDMMTLMEQLGVSG
jgi:steroid delta-isomerase-like uncharacterized protein